MKCFSFQTQCIMCLTSVYFPTETFADFKTHYRANPVYLHSLRRAIILLGEIYRNTFQSGHFKSPVLDAFSENLIFRYLKRHQFNLSLLKFTFLLGTNCLLCHPLSFSLLYMQTNHFLRFKTFFYMRYVEQEKII